VIPFRGADLTGHTGDGVVCTVAGAENTVQDYIINNKNKNPGFVITQYIYIHEKKIIIIIIIMNTKRYTRCVAVITMTREKKK
jgi:hypothetical protein